MCEWYRTSKGAARCGASRRFARAVEDAAEAVAHVAEAVPQDEDEGEADGGDGDSGGDGVVRGDPRESDGDGVFATAEGDVGDRFGPGRDGDARGGFGTVRDG